MSTVWFTLAILSAMLLPSVWDRLPGWGQVGGVVAVVVLAVLGVADMLWGWKGLGRRALDAGRRRRRGPPGRAVIRAGLSSSPRAR